jgi:hypothetical protein
VTTKIRKPLPVKGYTPQSDEKIALVDGNKMQEEQILRVMDLYAERPDIDKRWLAIARTHLEIGFMALNRSVFQPQRLSKRDA